MQPQMLLLIHLILFTIIHAQVIYVNNPLSWDSAKLDCISRGSHLLTTQGNIAEVTECVNSANSNGVWIGLNRIDQADWAWTAGDVTYDVNLVDWTSHTKPDVGPECVQLITNGGKAGQVTNKGLLCTDAKPFCCNPVSGTPAPTAISAAPTDTTSEPTNSPTTAPPTDSTAAPTDATSAPTISSTTTTTDTPTAITSSPTDTTSTPTISPTTASPTDSTPAPVMTASPTDSTSNPTISPTVQTTASPTEAATVYPPPNIIFLLLDDLGFSDIGYNGATYPTPVFDDLASTNAIKFNWHYSESTCSPSRSSLYTGRYAFKSGLNKNVDQEAHYHFDPTLTLYPELLQDAGYNTFIAGKWDVGYKYADITPPHRGFDEGLYPHNWRPYQMKANGFSLPKYDILFPTTDLNTLNTRDMYFPNGRMAHWDLWKIVDGEEVPALIGDTTNNEQLYAESILEFIGRQTADNPFYVHYNLITPHSPITEPPALKAGFTYTYEICNIPSISTDKQLFCRAMLYAQEIFDRIIRKTKGLGLYGNTLFIAVSDNGGDQEQNVGVAEGQNLPLRGLKTGVNEGGIRTPAFMFGGYLETLFTDLGLRANSECVYNKLVHISDWYNIITDIAGIVHGESDVDHSNVDVWNDIVCECDPDCDSSSDSAQERTEIMSMRICGDESKYGTDMYPDKTFYATFIIQWPWKLVINSSISYPDDCPNGYDPNWVERNSYTGYNGELYTIPNQEFFDLWYQPQIDAGRGNLYQSQCLDALNGTDDINDPNYPPFKFDQFLLYNLETDPIEACNVATNYPLKVSDLWDEIQLRSLEYTPIQNIPASSGAMWAKVNSYDCATGYTFILPWEGRAENECGPVDDTQDNLANRECAQIWRALNDKAAACQSAFGVIEDLDEYDSMDLLWLGLGLGAGSILWIVVVIFAIYCFYKKRKKAKLQHEIDDVMERIEKEMGSKHPVVNASSIEFNDGMSIDFDTIITSPSSNDIRAISL